MVAEWGTQLEIELLSSPQPVGPMVRFRQPPVMGKQGREAVGREEAAGAGEHAWRRHEKGKWRHSPTEG